MAAHVQFDPDKHCGAIKKNGEPCCRSKGAGTPHRGVGHCARHLGNTATHVANGQRLLAEREVQRLGLTLAEVEGQRGSIDPREALALELYRTHINVAVLEQMVRELKPDQLHGPLYHADGGTTGRALPHVLVTMLADERRHLVLVAAAAARAGVEERRVEIEQEKAREIADLIRASIDAIQGLTAAQRQQALMAAAAKLRALPGGAA